MNVIQTLEGRNLAPVLLMWSKPPPEVPSLLSPHSECRQPDLGSCVKWQILLNDSESLKSLCGEHGISTKGNDEESEIGNLMLPHKLEWQSCGKCYFSLLFLYTLGL